MTPRHSFAAALAAMAIAMALCASANAVPVDSPPAAQQLQRQDLRSADAIDATVHPRRQATGVVFSPGHAGERASRPIPPATAKSGDGVDWATVGLAVAGWLVVMGAIAALASRTRRAPRTRAGV